jgi:hypothetical protein
MPGGGASVRARRGRQPHWTNSSRVRSLWQMPPMKAQRRQQALHEYKGVMLARLCWSCGCPGMVAEVGEAAGVPVSITPAPEACGFEQRREGRLRALPVATTFSERSAGIQIGIPAAPRDTSGSWNSNRSSAMAYRPYAASTYTLPSHHLNFPYRLQRLPILESATACLLGR